MNFSEVNKYINRLDLIKETASQLIKDFDMFGIEIKFSGNAYNAYDELFEQIELLINHLIKSNQSKFMGILYRIDISDEQLQKAVKLNNSESFSEIITDIIIKRELQKIIIRNHFKKSIK